MTTRTRRRDDYAAVTLAGVVIYKTSGFAFDETRYIITHMPSPYRAPVRVAFKHRYEAVSHAIKVMTGKVRDDQTPKNSTYHLGSIAGRPTRADGKWYYESGWGHAEHHGKEATAGRSEYARHAEVDDAAHDGVRAGAGAAAND